MSSPARIYLDYNATTPLDPGVREVLLQALDQDWGNPSSVHALGRKARARLDEARERLADLLGCQPNELIFTSGGTEANNLAVLGTARALRSRGRHLICSSVEHPAVLHAFQYLARYEGFVLTLLPVDALGRVDPEDLSRALRPETVLVSVMAANNETGTRQPISDLGRLCRSRGVLFHTDAVQWFGKTAFNGIGDLEADLVSLCAHKFHGPKGVGALYVRSPFHPHSLLLGGSHENERRAGTENLPNIVGLAEAAARFIRPPVFVDADLRPWRDRLASVLAGHPAVTLRGCQREGLSNTLAFTVRGTDSIALLAALDLAGVCASSGSACASGSLEPSHVLRAMGVTPAEAGSLVRLSLGRDNTDAEVRRVGGLLPGLIDRVGSASGRL